MESNSPKRRKLDHAHGGPTLDSAASSSMGASGSGAFVLETDELLREAKLDYSKEFPGLDQTLRQFKEAIEGLEPYGPVPVRTTIPSRPTPPRPRPRPRHAGDALWMTCVTSIYDARIRQILVSIVH